MGRMKNFVAAFLAFMIALSIAPSKIAKAETGGIWEAYLEDGKKHNIYVRPFNTSILGEIAYCYNKYQQAPVLPGRNSSTPTFKRFTNAEGIFQSSISIERVEYEKSVGNEVKVLPVVVPKGDTLKSKAKKSDGSESVYTYEEKFKLTKYAWIDESTRHIYDYKSRLLDDELEKAILKVIYNGFNGQTGKSEIQAKLTLTDDEMKTVTQYAVWFYTDSAFDYERTKDMDKDREFNKYLFEQKSVTPKGELVS